MSWSPPNDTLQKLHILAKEGHFKKVFNINRFETYTCPVDGNDIELSVFESALLQEKTYSLNGQRLDFYVGQALYNTIKAYEQVQKEKRELKKQQETISVINRLFNKLCG